MMLDASPQNLMLYASSFLKIELADAHIDTSFRSALEMLG